MKISLAVPLVVSMVATLAGQATDPSPHTVAMVSVAGVRVSYLDWGGTGPALVFVAGLGNSAHVFDDFAPRFARDHRVLAVTRTGYGEADQPERDGYDIASRVAHIRAGLDAAGIAKAVLVGHSLGGDEITAFAVAHADRTAAVIYVDAAMDHAATLQRVMNLGPQIPVPPDITREERTSRSRFPPGLDSSGRVHSRVSPPRSVRPRSRRSSLECRRRCWRSTPKARPPTRFRGWGQIRPTTRAEARCLPGNYGR